jgi:hypothetical protein
MKLPNVNKVVVAREKIADYLLNPVHPDNGGKADFFTQLGFHRERWEVLAEALKTLAVESEVTIASESPHGKKYVMVGRMQTPAGKSPLVQTISG